MIKKFHEIDFKNSKDKYIVAIDPGWNLPIIYSKEREYEEGNDMGYDIFNDNFKLEEDAVAECIRLNKEYSK